LLSESSLQRDAVVENQVVSPVDSPFYDEVVKQLSLQDYKDIVESLADLLVIPG
jgi:hypothetical protein